jgi:ferredoxin
VSAVAAGLGAGATLDVDLTLRRVGVKVAVAAEDLAVFGVPVYAGRVAATAVERMRLVKGQDTPAVLVAIYGNRAYEDALAELADLVSASGFVPVAAAAFIGEHSFSTEAVPLAAGRPDAHDLELAVAFGRDVRAILGAAAGVADVAPLVVPGNRPYRKGVRETDSAPETLSDLCTLCGKCADACPVGAVTVLDSVETDGWACTLCCACTRACPTGARVLNDAGVLRTMQWLAREYSARKAPELFLP